MQNTIKVILVDDNKAFVKAMSTFISRHKEYTILDCFNSGDELLKSNTIGLADIILLDIEMPGINGVETAKQINFNYPKIKIIAVTMYKDRVYLSQLVGSGINGFISKTQVPEGIFTTMEEVLQNRFLFPEDINI